MKLNETELAAVKSTGIIITEKCDGCGKFLNQTFRYTVANKPEVYCEAACRDVVFFGNKKHSSPGKCVCCGGSLEGKRRGALYCDEICRKRHSRKEYDSYRRVEITRTPAQSILGL